MPETRVERLVLALGIGVVGLLVAAIVWRPHHDPRSAGSEPKPPSKPVHHATTTAPATTAPVSTVATLQATTTPPAITTAPTTPALTSTAPTATAPTTTAPAPPPLAAVRLQLTARVDTWVSVRRGSSTGTILFEGTMAGGSSRTFTGTTLAIRFGAAANVSAKLNGRPLALPGGTYSVDIGTSGLGPRSA